MMPAIRYLAASSRPQECHNSRSDPRFFPGQGGRCCGGKVGLAIDTPWLVGDT